MYKTIRNYLYYLAGAAIIAGFILTLISWWGACTEACVETHKYRIFGLSFEILGLAFFIALTISYAFSRSSTFLAWMAGLLLAAGLGAEVMFILVQKYMIGGWCPLCLGIAASVAVAAISFALASAPRQISLQHVVLPLVIFAGGFAMAFAGIAKQEDSSISLPSLKESLAMGAKDSKVEIYVFTSWICPACKRFEPNLERIIPRIDSEARIIFVDNGDDAVTLNFLPYDVAFLINDKALYLQLRHELKNLSNDTDTPTDEQVDKAIAALGVKYHALHNAQIALITEYFKELSKEYKVTALPAFVIINPSTGKQKMLTGLEITAVNVKEAIDECCK